jgi:hypothetical protein
MHGADKRMSQPEVTKTNAYVGGVEKVNGQDAWALFKACAAGDMPKVKALLAKDRRLVNVWFSYQLPVHLAARAGHAEIVKLLLDRGANPGNDWEELFLAARERGHRQVEGALRRAMSKRFNYSPDFDALKGEEKRDILVYREKSRMFPFSSPRNYVRRSCVSISGYVVPIAPEDLP